MPASVNIADSLHLIRGRIKWLKANLESEAIAIEIKRGYKMGITSPLAGIALVEMAGVNESTSKHVQAGLQAARLAEGLVISWDLWHTPFDRLDAIRHLWEI